MLDVIISHAITALLGALIAAAVTYLILARTKSGRSAASARAELKQYRERVADHFASTAALVDQLTDSYKDVFDQLQAGATELLDADTLREKLAHQDAEVITLNRLGYRQPDGDETPGRPHRDSDEREAPPSDRQPADAVTESDPQHRGGENSDRPPADAVAETDEETTSDQKADDDQDTQDRAAPKKS